MNAVLDIRLLSYRAASTASLLNILDMVQHTAAAGVEVIRHVVGNANVHSARNLAFASFDERATHMLMVDDDMQVQEDGALRLLKHDVPVVSGICTTRRPPLRLVLGAWNDDRGEFVQVGERVPDRLVSGPLAVGGAFLLIRRDAIEASIEDYLSAADWLRRHRRSFDRMKVRREARLAEQQRIAEARRGQWGSHRRLRVFDIEVDETRATERTVDYSFCNRMRELGIPVAIDGGLPVGHLGEYPYGVWDLFRREDLQDEKITEPNISKGAHLRAPQ